MILTVALNPAIDRTIIVKTVGLGKESPIEETRDTAGGKAVNVSRVIKSLGGETLVFGFAGGINGKFLKEELFKESIQYDFIQIKGETRLCLTILPLKGYVQTRFLERGPCISSLEMRKFKGRFKILLDKADIVIFSGSVPPSISPYIYAELIHMVKKRNIKTVLDTSGEALVHGINAKPFIVKPNLKEIQGLLKRKLTSLKSIKEAVKKLITKGISMVAVSMGDKGVVAGNDRTVWSVVPPVIKAVNPVGSGAAVMNAFLIIAKKFLKENNFQKKIFRREVSVKYFKVDGNCKILYNNCRGYNKHNEHLPYSVKEDEVLFGTSRIQ